MPKRQILAYPTLHSFGDYDYFPITLAEAQTWLAQGEYYSTMRSRDMCHALREVTGRTIYPLFGAEMPSLEPGDEALVFKIVLSPTVRSIHNMSRDYMLENYQLGLLRRVDGLEAQEHQEEENEETLVEQEI